MKSFTASHIFILSPTFHLSFAFALILCWVYSPDLHFEVEKEVQKGAPFYTSFSTIYVIIVCEILDGFEQWQK